MGLKLLDTEALSAKYRSAAVDPQRKRLLITNFHGTEQEKDFSEPANCRGFGRVRHFRRVTSTGWPTGRNASGRLSWPGPKALVAPLR